MLRRFAADPFAYLGMHAADGDTVVRASLPQASRVFVRERHNVELVELNRIEGDGLFEGWLGDRSAPSDYLFIVETPHGRYEVEDPYRFGPILGDVDVYLIAEGTHLRLWEVLGSHVRTIGETHGVAFAVWAPNALRVSVVGDFNEWDGRRHPMRKRVECGVWEIFVPGATEGSKYKYEIVGAGGDLLPLKADPLARYAEMRPESASIVWEHAPVWNDEAWMKSRAERNNRDAAISIYEVHLGSWRRGTDGAIPSYAQLSNDLLPYVAEMGFTHVELLPITEHPFDGSWGYQPTGMFAPTSRFGTPADFRAFIDCAHSLGLGVILDWVPGHFPNDPHGLALFDGTHLYEHRDPRKGFAPDWNTLIYNNDRREVANFLIASALYWLQEFHIDALRVDAVASMLYLDYSRRPGEWVPNEYGGNENLEAIAFLRRLNETLYAACEGAVSIAEESTAWPMVSRPVSSGGLGFGYKWNMGWMHDTLRYFGYDPIYRRYHQNDLTFGLVYAFGENYILPLSHDEVVHGKRSLLSKMPGDRWQRFANLRLLFALMFTHPGKKLLFMGAELGAVLEWNHDAELDWGLLADEAHAGLQRLVRDCNTLYRTQPALHQLDAESAGFEWIDYQDAAQSVLAFARTGTDPAEQVVVAINATPVVHYGYRIGVAHAGGYREVLNTDSQFYGGSNVGNEGAIVTEPVAAHGRSESLALTLPPLAAVVLRR
ncbi:MAG TPA: 1,4-alpha-glucan branching protein GlgB [Candidatus Cybelea sp.]|jgi:1,4-alpha-glucan branching enzyme|nr:1,4-alpha-glucan branching protein GlgB [Candidatus Cybelea sp.]